MPSPIQPGRAAAEQDVRIVARTTEAQKAARIDRELRQLAAQLLELSEICQRLRANLL